MNSKAERTLKVQMLGEFKIFYGEEELSLGKISASKTIELFQLLMLNIKDGMPKKKIMQNLYNWEDVTNENHSMNNLIYRLKQQLRDAGIVQEEYICINDGICSWNKEIPLEIDVHVFEEKLSLAYEAEGEEKLNLLRTASSLFKEEFLFDSNGKAWITDERDHLKELYNSCVTQLAEILKGQEQYEELLQVYSKAAEIYPFEDWQAGQIDCLQSQGRFEEAYQLYQDTIQHYLDELGITLSETALGKIADMGNKLRSREGNINEIREVLAERRTKGGAFYCTYPSFVDIYRYTSRTMERSGKSTFFMMCSVVYLNSTGRKSPNAGDILCESIGKSLRKGDNYSRYSKDQFVIILKGTQFENCSMIFERIRKKFKKKNRNSNCDLEYNVAEMKSFEERTEALKFNTNTVNWH